MVIMYLTFGENPEYHTQAYYSMLSFRKQMTADDRLVMVTNMPQMYRCAEGWVETVVINDEQINEWKGKHQYMFRVKTMAVKMLASRYQDEHLLFLDTDTFLYGSLNEMKRLLDEGKGILHKDEGHPRGMKGPSLRMWNTVAGKEYASVVMGEQHHMWNSGIIGMPKDKKQAIIDDTLVILDGMLDDGVGSFNIEQYAMSVSMLKHTHVVAGEPYVAHYWGNKEEWNAIVANFVQRAFMERLTPEQMAERIDIGSLRKTPISVHHSHTAERLRKLVNSLFKDKDFKYL